MFLDCGKFGKGLEIAISLKQDIVKENNAENEQELRFES